MYQVHACAAKAGIDMMTRVLAMEWGEDGVRVNAIAPGPIADTEGMRRLAPSPEALANAVASVPLQRMGTLEDIAHMALFLSSPQAGYVTGAVIPVDGGPAARRAGHARLLWPAGRGMSGGRQRMRTGVEMVGAVQCFLEKAAALPAARVLNQAKIPGFFRGLCEYGCGRQTGQCPGARHFHPALLRPQAYRASARAS